MGRAPPVRTALLGSPSSWHLVVGAPSPSSATVGGRRADEVRYSRRRARRSSAVRGALAGSEPFLSSAHPATACPVDRALGSAARRLRYLVELALALTIRSLAFGLAAATSQWQVDSLAHLLHFPAPLNGSPERERGRSSERFGGERECSRSPGRSRYKPAKCGQDASRGADCDSDSRA